METKPKEMHCGYFREVFEPQKLVERAQRDLGPHCSEFDLLVGTGVSGTLAVGMLALAFNKRFVIVRKQNDGSHACGLYEGLIATSDRWVFVDDFISSGATFRRVAAVMNGLAMALEFAGVYTYHDFGIRGFRTEARDADGRVL